MISIQTNIDSLLAQQNLSVNNQFQSNTIQQLTSGYRINSSADDAAGLSVANGYRNQIAELNQGVLNANQGVSQLQIIDGGLSNISQMLDRLQTLATESASTTFTGNRQTLDTEYQGLLTEIGRQADNIGLGDNNASNAIDLGVYIGGGQSAEANSSVNVNLTGKSVSATGLGLAGTSVLTTQPVAIGTVPAQLIAPLDVDTFNVQTASGFHQITLEGKSGDTLQGQVNELNAQMNVIGINASLNTQGILQLQSASAFSVSASSDSANQAFDLVDSVNGGTGPDVEQNAGLYNLGYTPAAGDNFTISVGSSSTQNITLPDAADTTDVNTINQALQAAGITTVTAVLDESTSDGANPPNCTGISLQGSTAFTVIPGANTDVANAFTGTLAPAGEINPVTSGGSPPNEAINAITQAVQNLGTVQGIVGAGENTLNYAINLAQSQITSFSSAQSQIRDANVAQQAANLTKAQVLQQASIAAMAQANQEPQAVLALLKQ
jgi:flagellin